MNDFLVYNSSSFFFFLVIAHNSHTVCAIHAFNVVVDVVADVDAIIVGIVVDHFSTMFYHSFNLKLIVALEIGYKV